jgi:hypothetical protein
MPEIPFSTSSTPGQRPGEGLGRLINCYAEKAGNQIQWKRVPGLTTFIDTLIAAGNPRGFIDINGTLYAAMQDVGVTVNYQGSVVTLLSGSLSGSSPVTWARNNKSPTPDVVCVTENGAFSVTSTTISSFASPNLPQPNSVCSLGGYLVFSIGDGRVFASDLNAVTVNALSFATADSDPDGLSRGTVSGGQLWLWGPASTEVWANVGTSPFPFARQSTIPVGLLSPWCIAGFGSGWDGDQIFVAQDGTVRQMHGYAPTKISTPDVERAIMGVVDKTTIHASTYSVAGHSVWVLSSPVWTWCYDVTTGEWFERQSYGMTRWRGEQSVYFANKWIVGDKSSGKLFTITESALKEDTAALIFTLESGPVKAFPQRLRVPSAYFDFTTGQGIPTGNPDEVTPQVQIQWSHDGGATFSAAVLRRSLGQQGDYRRMPRVNRLGRSTHHGIRFRLTFPTDVYVSFRGGYMDALPTKP